MTNRDFGLFLSMDYAKRSLASLAEAVIIDEPISSNPSFARQGFQSLWLYSMGAECTESIVNFAMWLIGSSPRDQRQRASELGQKVISDLNSGVRLISEEVARSASAGWDSRLWLQASRIYLSCLWQSFESRGPRAGASIQEDDAEEAEEDNA